MSFRTNLQYLRAQRNMTQEQLAMLLGVSRQAISKWESEKAYPEMDKLLMICDLFGCTLDDLVPGDVSASVNVGVAARGAAEDDHGSAAGTVTGEGAGEPAYMKDADGNSGESARSGGDGIDGPSSANALPGETLCGTSSSRPGALANVVALPQDLTGYDEHRCRFALLIAGGVAAIIAGVGVGNLFDSDNSILGVTPLNDFLTFLCICVGMIIGLAMLIPGDMSHTDFKRRHPYVEDFYTEEDRSRELRLLVIGIVGGIAAILIGIAVTVYADDVLGVSDGWPAAIMLLLCAPAVFDFIYCGIARRLVGRRVERRGRGDVLVAVADWRCAVRRCGRRHSADQGLSRAQVIKWRWSIAIRARCRGCEMSPSAQSRRRPANHSRVGSFCRSRKTSATTSRTAMESTPSEALPVRDVVVATRKVPMIEAVLPKIS